MDASKEYMKENGYNDRISFQDGAAHTFTVLKDKQDSIPDAGSPGGRKVGIKYLVNEDGVEKEIFTGSIGLIGKLAKVEAGQVVTAQMKKANNKSFYVVTVNGEEVMADGETEGQIADDAEVPTPEKAGW